MKHFILFNLLLVLLSVACQAQQRKVIHSVDELPKHSYKLPAEKAEDIVNNKVYIDQLMDSIQHNILSDLKEYDIQDNATLRSYYADLRMIAFLQKDFNAFDAYLQKQREISDKAAEKFIAGSEMELLSKEIRKNPAINFAKDRENLKNQMIAKLKGIDFNIIQNNIENSKAMTEIYSAKLLNSTLKSQIQLVIDNNKGIVTLDIASQLPSFYYLLNFYLPAKDALNDAYSYMLKTYGTKVEKHDIWKDRNITFSATDQLTPVVIGIWDSGVDIQVFPEKNRWMNKKEKTDGIDNDENGFVDDVYGVAFDMRGNSSTGHLMPEGQKLTNLKEVESDIKGSYDISANISSEEASAFKKKIAQLEPGTINTFFERLGLYGQYAHGTHVSGIATDGNPAAKILVGRLTWDYHTIPFVPDEQSAKNWATMFKRVIDYFKANDVKVVNMSWTVGLETEFTKPMEANGFGKNDEERMAVAKKLFDIERQAFIQSAESAPQILFVCAAGNSNNDVDFAGEFPASLNLPNLITIGAVDSEGKKTSFTTEGKSVDVYSNGYEVESYVPGGDRIKFSGTSMASPQVVNLAAKLWAANPKLTVKQVKELILNTATKSDEGILLINPAGAYKKAQEM
jgi:subtilisin family serine protease